MDDGFFIFTGRRQTMRGGTFFLGCVSQIQRHCSICHGEMGFKGRETFSVCGSGEFMKFLGTLWEDFVIRRRRE